MALKVGDQNPTTGAIGLCESSIKTGYDVMFKVSLPWISDWYWRGSIT